jgi:hypothetical protein
MGSFIRRRNNANVPAGIQKDPINATNIRNHGAKVNNLYK